MLYNSS
ncbi:hypothetical protein LINPERHAP2_LOCUS29848 [Linum perenne]